MGFRRVPRPYRVRFDEDHELHGLEVVMRAPSIAEMTELAGGADELGAGTATGSQIEALFRKLAGCLISWNLEDAAGADVPATYEGLRSQDMGLVQAVLEGWLSAVTEPGPTSPTASTGGGDTELMASLPMAPLPPSPANSRALS